MVQSVFDNIQVEGMVTAVPKNCENLMKMYGAKFGEDVVASFSKKVGIVERRISMEEQTASDLAFVAARNLLEKKYIGKEEIGILVFVTQTPDYRIPASAFALHKRLGLSKRCMAFDVNLGCSGYVYGMQIICSLLKTTGISYGMLLVGDTISRECSPEDKSSAMLFGDSGSATLFRINEKAGSICTAYRADGSGFKNIIIPAGGYRKKRTSYDREKWEDGNVRSEYDIYMNGMDVFSFVISEVPDLMDNFLQVSGRKKENYDAFVLHQANGYIIKQIIKRCSLPEDKVPISLDRYGNTTVASIPLTICDKYGKTNERQKIHFLTCGFGIGMSLGIADFQMRQEDIYPIIETDEYYKEGGLSHV